MKTFFTTLAEAQAMAKEIGDQDAEWRYEALQLENSKFSVVLIYDEDDMFVGFL